MTRSRDVANIDTILTTKGDIYAASAAYNVVRLGVGTDGQVLTADSTQTTGLKWATVSGGGMTLLSTTSLSSTGTTVSGIDQTYTDLIILCQDITWGTANDSFELRLNNGTQNVGSGNRQTDGSFARFGPDATLATASINRTGPNCFVYRIMNYTASETRPYIGYGGVYTTGTFNSGFSDVGFIQSGVGAISSIRFRTNGAQGSLTGTIKIYGVK